MSRVAVVTRAERAVVQELVADGASNPEIADRLSITENTVKSHMKRLLLASGEQNRTALAVALLRGRLVLRPASGKHGEAVPR